MARATNSRRFHREVRARAEANKKRERFAEAGPVTVTTSDGTVATFEAYDNDEQGRVIKGMKVKRRPAAPVDGDATPGT